MSRADSPMYLSTIADDTTIFVRPDLGLMDHLPLRKFVSKLLATALASSVFPVPGGP
jgi:hypothetical protein